MGQALYRKYRSKNLAEIVGQEHITDTLDKALKAGRISHAYLFTGPRGTGKTSIARILAHEINGLPYTDDSQHMDIIEIDAASNRRIDEIRDLRDKVYVAPTSAKYKVYIIDEVHMLTREAFNALLKTLEEPPAHVVFILATTDAHKLPETIVSRTQRYSFRPIDQAKVIGHLRTIADSENITVTDEALTLIAEHGEGSFRDSISLLDQASSNGLKLELNDVQQLLGIPPTAAISELLGLLAVSASASEIMQQIAGLYEQGFQAASIAKQLARLVREQLVNNKLTLSSDVAMSLLAKLLEVPTAHDPERFLEISLLGFASISAPTAAAVPGAVAQKANTAEEPYIKVDIPHNSKQAKPASSSEVDSATEAEAIAVIETVIPEPAKSNGDQPLNAETWQQILDALKKKHNTLYGVARMAEPNFDTPGNLTLCFAFGFHQKRLSESKNQIKLQEVIEEAIGVKVKIDCTVDKDLNKKEPAIHSTAAAESSAKSIATVPASASSTALSTISNIFGDAQLLE